MTVIVPRTFLADGRPLSEAGECSIRFEVPFDVLKKMKVTRGLLVALK